MQEGEARGGWGRQREAWNRPVATVQQACIGECCVCAAGTHAAQKPRSLPAPSRRVHRVLLFYTADCCSDTHFQMIFMWARLIALKSPLVDVASLFRQ